MRSTSCASKRMSATWSGSRSMPSSVAQARIHCADRADNGAPECGRYQAKGPETAFLDEVDEHVGLADTKPGSRDALAAEGGLTLDTSDFQAGPLHRTGLRARGGGGHQRIVPRPAEAAKFGELLLHRVADRSPASATGNEVNHPTDSGHRFRVADLVLDVELGDLPIRLAPGCLCPLRQVADLFDAHPTESAHG